ncbi:hypothetical protein ScPMuIL_016731 [Solemya velum]
MTLRSLVFFFIVTSLVSGEDTTPPDSEELDFSQLKIEYIHKPECERRTQKHDVIYVHYTGFLEDGTQFDSSLTTGRPHITQLGAGSMIKGLEKGLLEMCVGEKRKVTIPPHLGFGEKGNGKSVGPGETVTYELEMVEISDGKSPEEMFRALDRDGDEALSLEEISDYMSSQIQSQGAYRSVGNSVEQILDTTFKMADTNKDGVLDMDELEIEKHDEL